MAKSKIEMYKEHYKFKKLPYYDCIIHVDGGCRGNRIATEAEEDSIGAAAFVVVKMPDFEGDDHDQYNDFIYCKGELHRARTNNELEYEAVILALKQIKQEIDKYPWYYTPEDEILLLPLDGEPRLEKLDPYKILIQCDSQLVVNQLISGWAVNIPRLKKLNLEAIKLIQEIESLGVEVSITWFDRMYNVADAICNLVMDTGANVQNVNWTGYAEARWRD